MQNSRNSRSFYFREDDEVGLRAARSETAVGPVCLPRRMAARLCVPVLLPVLRRRWSSLTGITQVGVRPHLFGGQIAWAMRTTVLRGLAM